MKDKLKAISPLLAEAMCLHSLCDAENVLATHSTTTSRNVQRSIVNAAAVMLVAHWEAFVECVFEQCIDVTFPTFDEKERRDFIKITSGRFNTPNSYNTNSLFLSIGISNLLGNVHLRSMPASKVMNELDLLVEARHFVAHGQKSHNGKRLTKAQVRKWLRFIRSLKHVFSQTVNENLKSR